MNAEVFFFSSSLKSVDCKYFYHVIESQLKVTILWIFYYFAFFMEIPIVTDKRWF